jgi:hypothetical protein
MQTSHAFLPPDLLPPGSSDSRVMVMAWAPQPAVLAHPAVRLFVSHGGLGSLYEGLSRGRPLLVMPFFADQHINAQHLANKRLGGMVRAQPLPAGQRAPWCMQPLACALQPLQNIPPVRFQRVNAPLSDHRRWTPRPPNCTRCRAASVPPSPPCSPMTAQRSVRQPSGTGFERATAPSKPQN